MKTHVFLSLIAVLIPFGSFSALAAMDNLVTIEGEVTNLTPTMVTLRQVKGHEVFMSRDWFEAKKEIRPGQKVKLKVDLSDMVNFNDKILRERRERLKL